MKYKEHFLLDTETAKDFVRERTDFFGTADRLEACEIGDGNINYVFRVSDPDSGRSLVVKQADRLLRSSGRPLDLHRSRIEAEILKEEGRLAPGFVPVIYDYCEEMCAVTMEDISAYKNLRRELLNGKRFPRLAEDITTFMVETLLPTTDLILDRHEKKKRVQLFTNIELCDITEDLVFTEPYWDYKGRNILFPGEEAFVERTLYRDEELHGEVGMLRDGFMNHAQALLHGDLHSGSIFINEEGLKVIDPEFAFYGPIGYDAGNVIGNLFFAWANALCTRPHDAEFLAWIEETITAVWDLFAEKLCRRYEELVTFPLYTAEGFKKQYLADILADTAGYAGTEMIRRTVGDSKVAEVTSVTEPDVRRRMDEMLITAGVKLIKGRRDFRTGAEIAGVLQG